MDVMTDEQGILGRDLGLDNPACPGRDLGLDNPACEFLPSDLEDIFKGDGSMCFSDDALAALNHAAYGHGSNAGCGLTHLNQSGQGHGLGPSHMHHDPLGHRNLNELADQLLHSQHQYQQQQQQQHHQQQHLPQNNSCDHQSPQNHQVHHHHSNRSPAQQQQSHNSSYCSISGQPGLPYDVYDNTLSTHTSLPESPPDSGSEPPYSPPDGNHHHQTMTADLKSTIPGSLPTLTQSMYLGNNNRLAGLGPTKAPPAYIGEPPKLSHLHQGGPSQLQQHHHPTQRGPMPFSSGLSMGQHITPLQIPPPLNHQILPAHLGSMSNIASQSTKKRKYAESPTGSLNTNMMHGMLSIKQEPPGAQFTSYMGECSGGDDDLPPYDIDSNGAFIDSTYQVIKWLPYLQSQWVILTDGDLKDLPTPQYRVDADKGFNFSVPDEAFVCQKKNHFQVTVHMRLHGNAKYIRTLEGVRKIENFFLHFYGVKMESQNQSIKIEQSQSDRSKKSFHPVKVDLTADQETKVTVGRLHFSETTSNNMRKKGKPNPDQRYFLLVVSLHAHSGDKDYMLVGSVSDRIIVRASNPGQFDSDVDVMWQKGQTQESVYHMGRVGVNTDHPDEAMTIHGNMRLTGHMTQPSDMRAKENIQEIDPKNQLQNVAKLRIYKYNYKEEYADHVGIPPENRQDTGVLAQEIQEVLPDAVQETGDVVLSNGETIENFLVVNKDRIYMENVGAVKELCKLTDNLEVRINQLEKMNQRLSKIKRFDSLKSTASSISSRSFATISTAGSAIAKCIGEVDQQSSKKSNVSGHPSRSNSSRNSSHSRMMSSSKLSLTSKLSQPLKNICTNRIRYVTIIALILIMAFCVAALAWLYILERQKPESSVPSLGNSQIYDHTSRVSHTNGTSVRTSNVITLSTHPVTSLQTTSTTTTTTTSSTTVTTARPATIAPFPTPAGSQPVLPPYPPCNEGFCESLCCPPPHEDENNIGNGENPPYVVGEGTGHKADHNDGDAEETVINNEISSRTTAMPQVATIVQLPNIGNYNPNGYNVINNLADNGLQYNVINHNLQNNIKRVYTLRKRRGADDAPRPTIRLVELDYTINDNFCIANGCQINNYSYYIPLNASFGYGLINLEFETTAMSYMALCDWRAMWTCPPPAPSSNDLSGATLQHTSRAQWSIRIGRNFRTLFRFKVIHPIKGHSVTTEEACMLESNEDYVVMTYYMQFQRQC
ncbi:unnamed protein product [Lymnaea stagnalis]|uniref:Myelin regulatory factor n=1 Tax=Lymnaea stagnalis TaxID=6523 RepID=A0AAV2H1Z0_LYMST